MSNQKTAFKKSVEVPPEKLFIKDDDPQLTRMYHISSEVLTSQEQIIHIAIQRKPFPGKAPDAIVLTDRRFIIYRPKMFGGAVFCDHIWEDLANVELEEGIMGSSLTLTTSTEKHMSVDYLPKAQGRRMYSVAREMQGNIRSQKQACEIEAVISYSRKNDPKPKKAKKISANGGSKMFKGNAQKLGEGMNMVGRTGIEPVTY